jgi:sialate O-acetylesterase
MIFMINLNTNNMNKYLIIVVAILLNLTFIFSANAQIKLPAIVSSNMVLQRNTTINLWGWAAPSEKITIITSWTKNEINVAANNDGTWKVEVQTTNSKAPQTISLKSKTSTILLENILFGEVWLCSGQSNMQMPLKGFDGQPTFGATQAIMHANNPNLRLFTVERNSSKTPLQNLEKNKGWMQSSPETATNFSAVAYFFGQQLQEILDVPVGLIHTSWGGSAVEAWMSNESLREFQTIDLEKVDISEKPNIIPTVLFNAMIHPIIPYTIKGSLWYQGENNRGKPEDYKKLFPAMVKDWRARWNIGDFPFYYAQIAPFNYGGNNQFEVSKNSAFMREAQLDCLDLIPNSGIAITLDLGDATSIHPPKKKEVADRLLMNALNQTYGIKAIKHLSPKYQSLEIKDNTIKLSFKNIGLGLFAFDTLKDFEIAGEDKVFYPAEAKIVDRKFISVTSEKVPNPVAVRYAWRNFVTASLFDNNLLPLSSFRTDNWTDATNAETN